MFNGKQAWITDPLFSFISRAGRRPASYRVGFMVDTSGIYLRTIFNPTFAAHFKRNLMAEPDLLSNVSNATKHLRSDKDVVLIVDCTHAEKRFSEDKISCFKPKELFGRRANTYTRETGTAPLAGNHFMLLLSDRKTIGSRTMNSIVKSAWPLFRAFYPKEALRRRSANLRRALAKIECRCEFEKIRGLKAASLCGGRLEAAHIIPYSQLGSDQAKNGLWLCRVHHLETEGRLTGSRAAVRLKPVRSRGAV